LILNVISFIGGLFMCEMDIKADKQEGIHESHHSQKRFVSWKEIKSLSLLYYLLMVSYSLAFGCMIALLNNINNMLATRFGFSVSSAGDIVMIYYLISALTCPFAALVVDKFGKQSIVMLILTAVLLFTNLGFAFLPDGTDSNPNYGVFLPIIGVTIFSSFYLILVFPSIPLIVEKQIVGTAAGIITCFSNLILTLLPIALGAIHDETIDFHAGYYWTNIALAIVTGIGFLLGIWIYFEDHKHGSKLDTYTKRTAESANTIKRIIEQEGEEEEKRGLL